MAERPMPSAPKTLPPSGKTPEMMQFEMDLLRAELDCHASAGAPLPPTNVVRAPAKSSTEEMLQFEIDMLKAEIETLKQLDILVVWNGEDGGPRVRAVAPTHLREQVESALDRVWEFDPQRDSLYKPNPKPKAYLSGERRPCATIFRCTVQSSREEIEAGEPDLDNTYTKYNMPDY